MDRNAPTHEHESDFDFDQRLGKQQKLEMLGALAGFIAHDLNNELTVILGNVGLALDSLDSDHSLYEGLVEAQQAAHRSVEMTRALLNLGQTVKPELKPVSLDQLFKGTERILRKVLPSTHPAKFTRHAHLPTVMADASQIQQVIMNLAANASRSMPEECLLEVQAKNGPKFVTITIAVSSVRHMAEARRLFQPLSGGTLSRDSGTFGLSRDVEIVRAHGGSIDMARDVDSITFRISLPSMSRSDQTTGRARSLTEGSACVLIADDEGPVRRAAVQILLRKGYNVMEASDGEEAVRVFQENMNAIDLVFLDMTMPGLSGLEALEEMRKIRPKLKALVASGYPLDLAPAHFLAKPYSPLDLVRRIQEVLNASDESEAEPA
ncbi:MAG TPA: response regulator [Bryobacteraceae bacterium]|nr:response regulator [Bryobacteraceae bacterium]